MEHLTPGEVRAVAAEIDAWNSHYPPSELANWRIHAIAHLDMQIEAYEVTYENGAAEILFRNEDGKLEPAEKTVYYAPTYQIMRGQQI